MRIINLNMNYLPHPTVEPSLASLVMCSSSPACTVLSHRGKPHMLILLLFGVEWCVRHVVSNILRVGHVKKTQWWHWPSVTRIWPYYMSSKLTSCRYVLCHVCWYIRVLCFSGIYKCSFCFMHGLQFEWISFWCHIQFALASLEFLL